MSTRVGIARDTCCDLRFCRCSHRPVSQRGAAAAALDALADAEADHARSLRLRDDAYTARAYLRAEDREVRRLRRLLRESP